LANPSGLLQGAVMMLNHLGQNTIATKVHNAWLKTLEDGIHTYDIFKEGSSAQKVGTKEFAQAVIANLGQKPKTLSAVNYENGQPLTLPKYKKRQQAKKELIGHDVFVHWNGTDANELAAKMNKIGTSNLKLSMITNRGIKVWPEGFSQTFCTDHWRCRFKTAEGNTINKEEIIALLQQCIQNEIDTIKTENLYQFDGKMAFSLGQGQ
jgi:isocitrate dehydrogenase